jgi:hypothetical protein
MLSYGSINAGDAFAPGVRDQNFDFERRERCTTIHPNSDVVTTDGDTLAKGRENLLS